MAVTAVGKATGRWSGRPGASRQRRRGRGEPYLSPGLIRLMAWVVFLGAWELYGRYGGVNPILITYPTAVAGAGAGLIANGELFKFMQPSMLVLTYGLLAGTVVGIPFGILIARVRLVEYTFDTFISTLYSMPMVALVPLIVLWFGFTLKAKVIIVGLFTVFPILINTVQGVKNVDDSLLEVARSFRSPERRTWIDVIIPSAMPFIVTGLRLAVGRSLVGMVLAEFYTAITGLGYMIVKYANAFATAKLFVPIVVIGALGVTLTAALNLLEKRLAPWRTRS